MAALNIPGAFTTGLWSSVRRTSKPGIGGGVVRSDELVKFQRLGQCFSRTALCTYVVEERLRRWPLLSVICWLGGMDIQRADARWRIKNATWNLKYIISRSGGLGASTRRSLITRSFQTCRSAYRNDLHARPNPCLTRAPTLCIRTRLCMPWKKKGGPGCLCGFKPLMRSRNGMLDLWRHQPRNSGRRDVM